MVAKASNFCASSYAAVAPPPPLPAKERSACCHKVAECVCSACVLSICCPLSIAWCCIKIPCRIGWILAQNARNGTCCGSHNRIHSASYSSFSDFDSDDGLARGDDSCKTIVAPAKKKRAQRLCLL